MFGHHRLLRYPFSGSAMGVVPRGTNPGYRDTRFSGSAMGIGRNASICTGRGRISLRCLANIGYLDTRFRGSAMGVVPRGRNTYIYRGRSSLRCLANIGYFRYPFQWLGHAGCPSR